MSLFELNESKENETTKTKKMFVRKQQLFAAAAVLCVCCVFHSALSFWCLSLWPMRNRTVSLCLTKLLSFNHLESYTFFIGLNIYDCGAACANKQANHSLTKYTHVLCMYESKSKSKPNTMVWHTQIRIVDF